MRRFARVPAFQPSERAIFLPTLYSRLELSHCREVTYCAPFYASPGVSTVRACDLPPGLYLPPELSHCREVTFAGLVVIEDDDPLNGCIGPAADSADCACRAARATSGPGNSARSRSTADRSMCCDVPAVRFVSGRPAGKSSGFRIVHVVRSRSVASRETESRGSEESVVGVHPAGRLCRRCRGVCFCFGRVCRESVVSIHGPGVE